MYRDSISMHCEAWIILSAWLHFKHHKLLTDKTMGRKVEPKRYHYDDTGGTVAFQTNDCRLVDYLFLIETHHNQIIV